MKEIYSDIGNPVALASIDKLYREIKKVTENDVQLFLSGQDSYTPYH